MRTLLALLCCAITWKPADAVSLGNAHSAVIVLHDVVLMLISHSIEELWVGPGGVIVDHFIDVVCMVIIMHGTCLSL